MMNTQYFMGIDVGTNETKGVLVDSACNIVAISTQKHDIDNPSPNFFEQDAEKIWWSDVCCVSLALIQKSGVPPEEISCLGISALGCDCVPVDENCTPLCKAILYGIDSRSYKEIEYLNGYYGEDAEKLFGHPLCSSDISPKILWIKNNLPDVYSKTYKFLTASSFITAKLTGRFCIDKYLAEDFAPLYNLKTDTVNEEMCGIFCKPSQLAEIMGSTEIAGNITSKASIETGLTEDTKVLVGTGDSGAEAISTGIFQPGDIMIQLGSSCYIIYLAEKLINDNRVWPGKFIIPNTFSVCAGTNTAGTLTKWFRDELYFDMVEAQTAGGKNAFTSMAEDIRNIPAGSDGLITLPYFAGERTPINDPFAKGVFFGLKLTHTRSHLYKSALEGIGYSIAQHFDVLKENNLPIKKIMVVGGGTQNMPWLQIVADILGKTICTSKVTIGACFGDAIMAALANGAYSGWADLENVIKPALEIKPNMLNHAVYQKNCKIFNELYSSTKEMMHSVS
jgi:xylulokinase